MIQSRQNMGHPFFVQNIQDFSFVFLFIAMHKIVPWNFSQYKVFNRGFKYWPAMRFAAFRISVGRLSIRYLLRFFDHWAHETTYAYIGNKHFFTKSCHRWVSSTSFRVPFHVLVWFRNRGISSIIICKWSVQKTFQE